MKKLLAAIMLLLLGTLLFCEFPDGSEILEKIDKNMYAESIVVTSQMIIHGRRTTRTLMLKSWTEGENRSFTEFLSPPTEAGTKMLKLHDELWIYDPDADRIIQISGHMLRQSMMGSDISYEDMMEENAVEKLYTADVIGEEVFAENDCWILELNAKKQDIAYQQKKVWVEKNKFLPLKEELFGKSGKLLKTTEIRDFRKIGERWYPVKMIFRDNLKKGKGTEFIIDEIEFNLKIHPSRFSKASLRK